MNLNKIVPQTVKSNNEILDINRMKKAAIGYVQKLGFSIFPCHSHIGGQCTCGRTNCRHTGKEPAISNGVKGATKDIRQIEKWWSEKPYNIAIACGKVSNIFVVDIDVSETRNGFETLRELEAKYGELNETPISITGGDGNHYFYRYVEGIKPKVDVFPGIDIRGTNSYVIAPQSLHASGKTYQWDAGFHPLEIKIQEAPDWLISAIREPVSSNEGRPLPKPSSHWGRLMQGLSEGEGRNSAAASIAGHLLRRYVDPVLVVEIVKNWNKNNRPALDEIELNTILESVAGIEKRRREAINE